MSRAELDAAIASLRRVGGLYEILALIVERDNRPHVEDALSPVRGSTQ